MTRMPLWPILLRWDPVGGDVDGDRGDGYVGDGDGGSQHLHHLIRLVLLVSLCTLPAGVDTGTTYMHAIISPTFVPKQKYDETHVYENANKYVQI